MSNQFSSCEENEKNCNKTSQAGSILSKKHCILVEVFEAEDNFC